MHFSIITSKANTITSITETQLIIFYLKCKTISKHSQLLSLDTRYFQNGDVNFASAVMSVIPQFIQRGALQSETFMLTGKVSIIVFIRIFYPICSPVDHASKRGQPANKVRCAEFGMHSIIIAGFVVNFRTHLMEAEITKARSMTRHSNNNFQYIDKLLCKHKGPIVEIAVKPLSGLSGQRWYIRSKVSQHRRDVNGY